MFGIKKKKKVIIEEVKKELETQEPKKDVYFQLTGKHKSEVNNDKA